MASVLKKHKKPVYQVEPEGERNHSGLSLVGTMAKADGNAFSRGTDESAPKNLGTGGETSYRCVQLVAKCSDVSQDLTQNHVPGNGASSICMLILISLHLYLDLGNSSHNPQDVYLFSIRKHGHLRNMLTRRLCPTLGQGVPFF